MSELQSLINRLEAADGPDRELDVAICGALRHGGVVPSLADGWEAYIGVGDHAWAKQDRVYVRARHATEGDHPLCSWVAAPLTASVDAALALAERVLPGWTVQMSVNPRNVGNHARVAGDHLIAEPVGFFHGNKPPALTLCIAILKALESQK